jgi:hypothetical protein
MNNYSEQLANLKKGAIFYNEDYIYGMIGNPSLLPESDLKKYLETTKKDGHKFKYSSQNTVTVNKKKVNIFQFMVIAKFNVNSLTEYFNLLEFTKI